VVKTSVAVAFVSVYELLNYKNERKQDEYNKKSDKKLRPVYKKDLEEGYQRWDVTTTTTSN
jgi:Na+/H+ antiporter NhaB